MEHTYELSIPDSTTNSREEQSRARVLRNRVEEEGEEKQYSRGKSTGGLGGEQSKDGENIYTYTNRGGGWRRLRRSEHGRRREARFAVADEKSQARSQAGSRIHSRG